MKNIFKKYVRALYPVALAGAVFSTTALTSSARAEGFEDVPVVLPTGPRGVQLMTLEEQGMADDVFGDDDFNIMGIKKKFYDGPSLWGFYGGMALTGRSVKFFGRGYFSDNYALEAHPERRALFLHEVFHQYQRHEKTLTGDFRKSCEKGEDARLVTSSAYDYKLFEDSKFDHFCREQRAAMIGDYVRRDFHLFGQKTASRHLLNAKSVKEQVKGKKTDQQKRKKALADPVAFDKKARRDFLLHGIIKSPPVREYPPEENPEIITQDSVETDVLLRRIVEEKFPQAKETRLKRYREMQQKKAASGAAQ